MLDLITAGPDTQTLDPTRSKSVIFYYLTHVKFITGDKPFSNKSTEV